MTMFGSKKDKYARIKDSAYKDEKLKLSKVAGTQKARRRHEFFESVKESAYKRAKKEIVSRINPQPVRRATKRRTIKRVPRKQSRPTYDLTKL